MTDRIHSGGTQTDHSLLEAFLEEQRWFAERGRAVAVVDVRRVARLPGDEPVVTIELVTVRDGRTGATADYQLPLASYLEPQNRLDHALVGSWADHEADRPDGDQQVYAYDALHDRLAMDRYLRAFAAESAYDGLSFHRLPGHELDVEAHSTLFTGEQSNSSVAFGDDAMLKVFRKLAPGRNPDIEIHRVLAEAGSRDAAELYGWLELGGEEQPLHLAMLQEFLRTASDGFELALASVRNLYAEADLHADEVGGDFDGESHRLGATVAEVHGVLREHFPTEQIALADLSEAMTARLDDAVAEVDALTPYADGLRALFADLPDVRVPAQRVHGDLHLGQTLRTSLGWKLVDFEGEPAKPLAERVRPDSPWRDVAGVLRSFDYAARTAELDFDVSLAEERQLSYRGDEWVSRNRLAFLDGYAHVHGAIEADTQALIRAYEADKAVYEVRYEASYRPHWLQIPLGAVARLTGTHDE